MMDDIKQPGKDQSSKPPEVSSRISIPITQSTSENPPMTKSASPIIEPINSNIVAEAKPSEIATPSEVKETVESTSVASPSASTPVELSDLDVSESPKVEIPEPMSADATEESPAKEDETSPSEEPKDPGYVDGFVNEGAPEVAETPKVDIAEPTSTEDKPKIPESEPEATVPELKHEEITEESPAKEDETSPSEEPKSEEPKVETEPSLPAMPIMTPVSTEEETKVVDDSPRIETKTGGIPVVEVPEMEDNDVKGKVIPASIEHKKKKFNVMAILIAVLLAFALAGGAGFAYLQNSKSKKTTVVTPTPVKKVETKKTTPITSSDLDKAETNLDTTVKELDSTNDLMTTDLSDTGLGLL